MNLPSQTQFNSMFSNDKECVKYLAEKGVFYRTHQCPSCGRDMKQVIAHSVFRCQTKKCKRRQVSLRSHTFFFGSRLSCLKIMRLANLWLSGATPQVARLQTGHGKHAVADFYRHFRHLVSSSLLEHDRVIGGQGITVEIDETKLGKRKYHRGHRVDGVWVVVGIERTQEARIFLVAVDKRDETTLLNLISSHVAAGSTIMTDRWRGYLNITEKLGFDHFSVNHSKEFKNYDTGACTNKAEGLNNGLKMKILPRNRIKNGIEGHLGEYIWRRNNKGNLWNAFIQAMVDMHYDLK